MNIFGINANGTNKVAASSGSKKSAGTGEDFLAFLSKAAESDKPVQEKTKAEGTEKQETKDEIKTTAKDEKIESKPVEKETTDDKAALEETQPKAEENVMAAYLNQMAVTPLLVNRNTANFEDGLGEDTLNLQAAMLENTGAAEETATGALSQNNNQANLQSQMLDYLKSNLTEEQQVQRLNMVDALNLEKQEDVFDQETVRVVKNEDEENPLLDKQQLVQTEVVEETVVTQAASFGQQVEGQINIPISDSSTLIQSQPALQVADKILVNIQNGVQEFNMTLNPEKLGQVAVKMVIENGIVNLHVQVHNAAAHSALAAGLGELRALLENNNLQVAEIEISMYNGEEQQEKEAAQQENRKGQARYHGEALIDEEISEEEQVVVENRELDYSV